MKNYLVSIIIPTYNQKEYIGQAIESALIQDYSNLEIIIADDKSTDNTIEFVRSYLQIDSRVKYFCNSENLGRVNNYRKALYEYASGDLVLNLDGDDLLIDSTFISESVKLFIKYPHSNLLVGGKQYRINSKVVEVFHVVDSQVEYIDGLHFILNLFIKYKFSHLTTIYKRNEAIKLNFFREDIISSDMESILRLALLDHVLIYNKIVAQWNYTGKNESTNQEFSTAIRNLIWIKNVYNEIRHYSNVIVALVWKMRMKYIYSTALYFVLKKQKSISFKQFLILIKQGILFITILKITSISLKKIFQIRN